MSYSFYIYSIAYVLSIFLSISRIPFADKYNIEFLITNANEFSKKLFLRFLYSKDTLFYIVSNAATILFFFLITFLFINLFKFVSIYVVIVFELLLLYNLLSLRTASDKIIHVYYSLLKYEDGEISEEIKALLHDTDIHDISVNIDIHDKDDVIALTTEIMAKYILEKGNIIIASMLLGPAFGVAHKALTMLFGDPNDKKGYQIYRVITITANYINSIALMLTTVILRLDYKNAFKTFLANRNTKTAFGYNEVLSIVAGALNISIGTPPLAEVDESDEEINSEINEIMGTDDSHDNDDKFALKEGLVGESHKYLEVNDIKDAINIYYTNSLVLFGVSMIVRFIMYISIG